MRWGLIGASTIAEQHMIAAIRATGGEVAAVVSTSSARAQDYAIKHSIPVTGTDLAAMLADLKRVMTREANPALLALTT